MTPTVGEAVQARSTSPESTFVVFRLVGGAGGVVGTVRVMLSASKLFPDTGDFCNTQTTSWSPVAMAVKETGRSAAQVLVAAAQVPWMSPTLVPALDSTTFRHICLPGVALRTMAPAVYVVPRVVLTGCGEDWME